MIGLDVLGGVKYADVCIKNWTNGLAAGVFLDKFGPADHFISDLAATGKCPRIRVQIVYEDDHHYYSTRHDNIIINGIHRLNSIKARYPSVDIQASPFCEHEISGSALAALWNKVKAEARGLTLVNNPDSKGAFYPGIVNEVHSTLQKGPGVYNFSYDGLACVDSNVTAFKNAHKGALTLFLWEPRFNGLYETPKKGEKRPPIATRTGYPDATFLKSTAYQATDKGQTHLAPHWLLKSHAENHGKGDPKAEHLCFISPVHAPDITLIDQAKNVVEKLPYYNTYIDGRYRYYSKMYGFQLAEKAMKAGSPLCDIVIGGKSYGKINPGFRDGTEYHNKVGA